MKLTDLGLTPAGVKATKKLTHQVHKATVAAGYDPKLKLGVLGIEIGQEQSTGLTSRLNEEQEASSNWSLLNKVARYINSDALHDMNQIEDEGMWMEAADLIVKELRQYKEGSDQRKNAFSSLSVLKFLMSELGDNFSRAARYNEQELKKIGHLRITATNLPAWIPTVEDLSFNTANWGFSLKEFSKAMYTIMELIVDLHLLTREDKGFPVVNATLKKLGLRARSDQPE